MPHNTEREAVVKIVLDDFERRRVPLMRRIGVGFFLLCLTVAVIGHVYPFVLVGILALLNFALWMPKAMRKEFQSYAQK